MFVFAKSGHSHLLKVDVISEDDQNSFKAKAGKQECEHAEGYYCGIILKPRQNVRAHILLLVGFRYKSYSKYSFAIVHLASHCSQLFDRCLIDAKNMPPKECNLPPSLFSVPLE